MTTDYDNDDGPSPTVEIREYDVNNTTERNWRLLGVIRAGGDLQVTIDSTVNPKDEEIITVRAFDSDANHMCDMAAFAASERDLLIAALPSAIELARDRFAPGRVGKCDWLAWTHDGDWVGGRELECELGSNIGGR